MKYHQLPENLKNTIQRFISDENSATPVFLFSREQMEYNLQFFMDEMVMEAEDIYYSVKTNNHLEVLKVADANGCNFEIGSMSELQLLKQLNVRADRIICSHPVKMPQHLKEYATYGVDSFAFDSESELEKIAAIAPGAKVFLRLASDNTGAEWKLLSKFGARHNRAISLMQQANAKGLKPVGISLHVGWNNNCLQTWQNNLDRIKNLVTTILAQGIRIDFVNLGGGFPAHLVDQYGLLKEIAGAIHSFRGFLKTTGIRLIAEPGSFIVANASVLMSKIYDIMDREGQKWVFLDSGICQGFYWILNGLEYKVIYPYEYPASTPHEKFIITGPTLDSHDVFSLDVSLPNNIQPGEFLCVFPGGAYTNSAKEYNGFPWPELVT